MNSIWYWLDSKGLQVVVKLFQVMIDNLDYLADNIKGLEDHKEFFQVMIDNLHYLVDNMKGLEDHKEV